MSLGQGERGWSYPNFGYRNFLTLHLDLLLRQFLLTKQVVMIKGLKVKFGVLLLLYDFTVGMLMLFCKV